MKLPVLAAALSMLLAMPLQAAPPLPVDGPGRFLGVDTCGNSQCHDSAEPWRNATVLMHERRIWQEQDPHARAYETLRGEPARRIASRLGLGAATEAEACLGCHSTQVPKAQQGPAFRAEIGIGCESCHGAGGNFLSTHVQPTATHAGNLAAGMYPLSDPQARAALCASCHVGDTQRTVTHAMFAAGHPRLRYEHDTFSGLLPAHARIDADYRRRKPVASHAQTWAAGQLTAARNLVQRIDEAHRDSRGLFPELSLFDCHACHQPFGGTTLRRPELGLGLGSPMLADAPLVLLPALSRVMAPELLRDTQPLGRQLQQAVLRQQGVAESTRQLTRSIDALSASLAARAPRDSDGLCLASAVLALPAQDSALPLSTAEAMAMSLSSLLLAEKESGRLGAAPYRSIEQQLDGLYALLRDEDRYVPAVFARRSAELRNSLRSAAVCP